MKSTTRLLVAASALPLLSLTATAQQWQFQHLGTVDLTSQTTIGSADFIGNNPSAVAWDGTDLYVAGFNNSGAAGDVAIVKITTPLTTPTSAVLFGAFPATPSLRGYSGLDFDQGALFSAYDSGASVADGVACWETTGMKRWGTVARGGSGVGFDPGPGGNLDPAGSGAGWTSFGSGRRSLNGTATGAVLFDSSNGMIINGAGTGTFWRDMDYDPDTGDIWLREGNNLISATRTGNNSVNSAVLVVDEFEADFVNGQNLAFLPGALQDVVIYNNREGSAIGQTFFEAIRVVDTSGNPVPTDFGTFAPQTAFGYYDFSYDDASGTLAVSDFTNRTVELFAVQEVAPGSAYCFGDGSGAFCPCAAFGGAGEGCLTTSGTGATLSASGNASVGADTLVLSVTGGPANKPGIFFQGNNQIANPAGDGILCAAGSTIRYAVNPLDASGAVSQGSFGVNAGVGLTRNYQYWFRDTGNPCNLGGFNFTNGWSQTWN